MGEQGGGNKMTNKQMMFLLTNVFIIVTQYTTYEI